MSEQLVLPSLLSTRNFYKNHMESSAMDASYGEIRIERLAPMRVAIYFLMGKDSEKEAAIFMNSWMKRNGIRNDWKTRIFFLEIGGEQNDKLRGYEYWVTVPDNITESEGVIIRDIGGDDYAVLRIYAPSCNDLERVVKGWKSLHDWVVNSKYKPASGIHRYWLEEIIENGDDRCLDIYYPIQIRLREEIISPELIYKSQENLFGSSAAFWGVDIV